jgi:hypothetical protein
MKSHLCLVLVSIVITCAACGGTTSMARSGPVQPSKPANCNFQALTTSPAGGFVEVGTVDVNPGPYGINVYRDIAKFKTHVQPYVCQAGGDAVVAHANGYGMYIKGSILKSTGAAASAPQPSASTGGCQYDTQCKGDRVCLEGKCVDPKPR